jgi:hypothetical protein
MSKKKKRQPRRSKSQATQQTPNGEASYANDFNPDYTYVIKDLKRIGALAGTFFVILIVLSFILS